VLAGGWHTEIALPLPLAGAALQTLEPAVPGARYLVFGWGARDYYMAANPGPAEVLRAMTPGPAVMLIIAATAVPAPSADRAFPVRISRQGAERLSRWLWSELAKGPDGRPQRLAAGPYPQSAFYAATGSYDLHHTCNTWTAGGLRLAGLPVNPVGVVFAHQVTDQLVPLAKSARALPR